MTAPARSMNIAWWHRFSAPTGHHDAAFTHKTYVHADDEDLKTGTKALAKIYKIN